MVDGVGYPTLSLPQQHALQSSITTQSSIITLKCLICCWMLMSCWYWCWWLMLLLMLVEGMNIVHQILYLMPDGVNDIGWYWCCCFNFSLSGVKVEICGAYAVYDIDDDIDITVDDVVDNEETLKPPNVSVLNWRCCCIFEVDLWYVYGAFAKVVKSHWPRHTNKNKQKI